MSRSNPDKPYVIANYLLEKSEASRKPLTNKALQKIVYYCQAWSLVIRDEKLFDEPIEAWIHGPAIPSLYRRYSRHSYNPIVEDVDKNLLNNLTDDEKSLIDEVWDAYGGFDAGYLEALTHREEPWQKARTSLLPFESSDAEITTDSMKEFYGKRLEESEQA